MREAQHALADDVPLHFGGASADGEGGGEEEAVRLRAAADFGASAVLVVRAGEGAPGKGGEGMSALYKNREGEVWTLVDVRPHPTFLGMVLATRLDTGETVMVQRRELQMPDAGCRMPDEKTTEGAR